MSKIKGITAREIKDSRQKPTVEVELETEHGVFIASVPSGASTGRNEALELRDEDGGVQMAIANINEIITPKLKNQHTENQEGIDKIMIYADGTENKSKLGANATLAVSLAVCRAGAEAKKVPLYQHIAELSGIKIKNPVFRPPLPMFNILNGGAHVHPRTKLDIQEFMIVPKKKSFAENLVLGSKIYQNLAELMKSNFGAVPEMGDEGGFAAPISSAEQALLLLNAACEGSVDVRFALDCAASGFYKDGKYDLEGREMTRSELLKFYEDLIGRFPLISIEDPFSEDDWEGFKEITALLSSKITVVGDDLTTTNINRIKEAHNKSACNGLILKLNQIGTVSETIEASNLAKSFGWKTIVSHRSGETLDSFIADLAVGTGADYLKSGASSKEERMVKYNRLLEIEQELNQK